MTKTIAFTGHRPNKLFGYDTSHKAYRKIKNDIKTFIKQNQINNAITGMALGYDQVAADAVIELKNEGYNINLEAAIPCRGHSSKWPKPSQEHYDEILKNCDKVTIVTDEDYTPKVMQIRNEYMVDNADIILGLWDGSKGGTANCIKYAKEKGKPVCIANPSNYGQRATDFNKSVTKAQENAKQKGLSSDETDEEKEFSK